MKAINTIFAIFGFLWAILSHADGINAIQGEINEIKHQVSQYNDSTGHLSALKNKLDKNIPALKNCENLQQMHINRLKKENEYINQPDKVKYLQEHKKQYDALLEDIQAKRIKCGYLLNKIKTLNEEISEYHFDNFQKKFFIQQSPFWKVMYLKVSDFPSLPEGYVVMKFLTLKAAANRIVRNMIFVSFILIVLKLLSYSSFRYFKQFQKIKLVKFFFIFFIFVITAPIQFMIIKTFHENSDTTLILYLNRPFYVFIGGSIIYYMYQHIEVKPLYQEVFILFICFIMHVFLLRLSFSINYYTINFVSFDKIICLKYIQLLCLQFAIIIISYWLFKRVLHFKLSSNHYLLALLSIPAIIFIIGMFGYIDMAIEVDLTLILIAIIMIWFLITVRIVFQINHYLTNLVKDHPSFFERYLGNFIEKAIFYLKFFISYIYLFAIGLFLFAMTYSIPLLFTPEKINNFYMAFFKPIKIGELSTQLNQIVYSIIIFQALNLLSYPFSIYLAKKILNEESAVEKTANIFYWTCFILNIIFIVYLLGANLSNFMILFGGLSFGIGLGLKNILSSLISSIILFVNRPFEVGDFIEINQTRGFVKKITLLETMVETIDKNILIFPNQYVASSVIQNITYADKSSHKVHIKYILMHFNLETDDMVQEKLLTILEENEHVLIDAQNSVKFIFSPLSQASDDARLEIIFSVKSLKNLNENLSIINRQIFKKLKSLDLEVRFEDLQQPLT